MTEDTHYSVLTGERPIPKGINIGYAVESVGTIIKIVRPIQTGTREDVLRTIDTIVNEAKEAKDPKKIRRLPVYIIGTLNEARQRKMAPFNPSPELLKDTVQHFDNKNLFTWVIEQYIGNEYEFQTHLKPLLEMLNQTQFQKHLGPIYKFAAENKHKTTLNELGHVCMHHALYADAANCYYSAYAEWVTQQPTEQRLQEILFNNYITTLKKIVTEAETMHNQGKAEQSNKVYSFVRQHLHAFNSKFPNNPHVIELQTTVENMRPSPSERPRVRRGRKPRV